jgi:hypothetical protein
VKLPDDIDRDSAMRQSGDESQSLNLLARPTRPICSPEGTTNLGPLVVPVLVVTEGTYLLATRLALKPKSVTGDFASGNLVSESVAGADWLRISGLVGRYRDRPRGTVDAPVVERAGWRKGSRDASAR